MKKEISSERLLAEIDDLIRNMPQRATIRHETPENLSWFGRTTAVLERWAPTKMGFIRLAIGRAQSRFANTATDGLKTLQTLLHEARYDLMMDTGNTSIAIAHGMVFDYLDEIRKIVEGASQELIFIDPYLDAEFVSRYLTHIKPGVKIRLLTSDNKLATLIPAVKALIGQEQADVELRTTSKIHDRYLFVDRTACHQSGASFKDGGKSAPTTISQIIDAYDAMAQTYETLWNGGKIEAL